MKLFLQREYSSIPTKIRKRINTLAPRFLRWRMQIETQLRKFGAFSRHYSVTILGCLFAGVLCFPTPRKIIDQYKNLDTIFIAAGGMIGTVIALVFSLSIIPIQRAVETLSPSVTRLYRDDRITQLIFIVLVACCLISFVFSIDGIVFGLRGSILLPVEMIVIAVALDLLRWHYHRVSQLLEPSEAIRRLQSQTMSYINQTQRSISKAAKIWWRSLPEKERHHKPLTKLETAVYANYPNHFLLINARAGELAEITNKAIARGETYTAELGISAMTQLACQYLNSRKDNLIVYPAPDMPLSGVMVSDVDRALDPIYEHFTDINRNATTLKSETISIKIIEALGEIAVYSVSLQGQAFHISWKPIGYLRQCVKKAQAEGFNDAGLRAGKTLLRFAVNVPTTIQDVNIYLPVVDGWNEIILAFLMARGGLLANEVMRNMMAFVHHILKLRPRLIEFILDLVLGKLYALVPLMVANETRFDAPFAPYDLTKPEAIGYLIEESKSLINTEEGEWVNPYHEFMDLNEKVYGHFRQIADHVDIGSSNLFWNITQNIKHISQLYLRELRNPVTAEARWTGELVNQITWYSSSLWSVCSKAKVINHYFAYDACNVLACIAMAFYEEGHLDVTETCAGNIASIADSYGQKTNDRTGYEVADLLVLIWHIRILAEAKEDAAMVEKIDQIINRLKILQNERAAVILEAFEYRKYQLSQELHNYRPMPLDDTATFLLNKLLR